jgi:hypothetical protein
MKKLSGNNKIRRRNGNRPADTAGKVVIFAYDKDSIFERERLLTRTGYRVVTCDDFPSGLDLIRTSGSEFEFLVIGHAVPEQERLRLAQAYRDVHRGGQVIFLYKTAIKNTNPPVAALISINGAEDNLLTAIKSARQLQTGRDAKVAAGRNTSSRKGGPK